MHKGIDRILMFDSGFRMVVPAIHSPKKCAGLNLPNEVGYPWEIVFKGQLTNSGFLSFRSSQREMVSPARSKLFRSSQATMAKTELINPFQLRNRK